MVEVGVVAASVVTWVGVSVVESEVTSRVVEVLDDVAHVHMSKSIVSKVCSEC